MGSSLIRKATVEDLAHEKLADEPRTTDFIESVKSYEEPSDRETSPILAIYLRALNVLSVIVGIDADELRTSRRRDLAPMKFCVVNYLRNFGFSLQLIGETMGRTHATVINALRGYADVMGGYGADGGKLLKIYSRFNERMKEEMNNG